MSKRAAGFKSDEKKKKAKTYHISKEKSPRKGGFCIETNVAGVMVMCARKKEDRAVREILDIFNEYADKLYPAEASKEEEEENEEEEEDIEAMIAKEVKAMSNKPKSKKRFVNLQTDTDCVLFIRTNPPVDPVSFVHHILTDIKTTQKKRTRFVSRLLPVAKTCNSNIPEIVRMAEELFKPYFHTAGEDGKIEPKKFAIVCRIRNCEKMDRQELTKSLAGVVGKDHTVDLVNPDLVIIVEIIQTIGMISVVKDFYDLKKYNIESICGLNEKKDE
ncbi:hypothetical protein K450DRAFT_257152 [Umbelopsis ramanniana AG]|uniref:THUMP domain-containing protein n=1 Tax=Umbelopsis ramanniana AG TaxID=1314678 RepID=A0AAD5E4W9_UMBRA|nr:uncharacterized protein K450DRAFT_257152 [Umbelopsis ramanniana AG]KAI8576410.1 hypothetical protein K450DRAFT_257152 [Umbelopsis ramanniana AG]